MALYHFARTADDLADEGDAPPHARLAALADYREALELAIEGSDDARERWPQVFVPLRATLRAHRLEPRLLRELISAFEQDVRNPGYRDREQLLDYCSRSANPVGRLLLQLYGVEDSTSMKWSDAICSALQLINFWQDLGRDAARGRHYVPAEDAARHGVLASDLRAGSDSPATRALVRDLCDWSEAMMRTGAPLALSLQGRAGWELRLVVLGGLRVLERIRAMDHSTLSHRPKLGIADVPLLLLRALRMRRTFAT